MKLSSVVYRTITRLQMIFVLIRPPAVSFDSINCVSIFQQKFDKLILMKITIRCHTLKQKCTKFDFGWGSAPDPAGELTEERRERKGAEERMGWRGRKRRAMSPPPLLGRSLHARMEKQR